MSNQSKKQLSEQQKEYAKKLGRILRRHRVALLQLPTGTGKTAIVMRAIRKKLTEDGWRVIFSMPRRWKVPKDGGRSGENGHNLDKGGRESEDPFELFPWLRKRDLQRAGYTEHIKTLRRDASNDPGKKSHGDLAFFAVPEGRRQGAAVHIFQRARRQAD